MLSEMEMELVKKDFTAFMEIEDRKEDLKRETKGCIEHASIVLKKYKKSEISKYFKQKLKKFRDGEDDIDRYLVIDGDVGLSPEPVKN